MAESSVSGNPANGPHIDKNGTQDPTRNVLDLVDAAIKRQDDLREAESRHVREVAGLRAEYQAELRSAETERINAIRAVDVAAVQQAAAVSEARATSLAGQVTTTAEALRAQVIATAAAQTVALTAALDPIKTDIADLRKTQYEQAGQKTQVSETRETTQAEKGGSRQWVGIAIAAAALGSTILLGVVGVIITLLLRSPGP